MSTVVIDPVTRIEGHLRIEAETDVNSAIIRASSAGTMLRGIEVIMQDRDPRDAWAIMQRVCGVCTSSHAIAAIRAVEDALNYPIPENAQIIRNLINGAQYVHDHVVHFYHLHAFDWVDIISALGADPKLTAEVQQCISPGHLTDYQGMDVHSSGYFMKVKEKLTHFADSGQLGIFHNGYWGHPEYKLPPEMNLLAFAHYLEALAWQRRAARLHSVFGGKNPHPNFTVGGCPCAISANDGDTRIDSAGLDIVGEVIDESRRFIKDVYLPDILAIARFYPDWFEQGEGVGNLLTFGDFPLTTPGAPDSLIDPSNMLFPRGVILNRDLSVIHPLDLDDTEQVQESVSNAWYDYSVGKDTPLHPYAGETTPNYSGPRPPYQNLNVDQAYSWIKSPRWRGQAVEVGPLAHIMMLYATGHASTKTLVNESLQTLKLPLKALYSTMGRTLCRALEAEIIADEMQDWYQQLQANIAAGDLRTHNADLFDPATWPAEARGVGFLEAPRGALGHWIVISNGKITNYQAVVPTTWNAGPRSRDAAGNEVTGPYEAALVGHTLHDPNQPLEILRTIHSFDPCLGCAVHLVGPGIEGKIQINIR